MPVTIESLAHQIAHLEQCSGQNRHAYTVVPNRVHLARGPHDTIELFLEGENVSFGAAAIGRSLEWGRFHDLNSGRDLSAVVLRIQEGATAVRLMAHIAYEAAKILERQSATPNSELLEQLNPFIAWVIQRTLLTTQQQMGLTGELLLLTELLNFVEQQAPPADKRLVLEAWKGWDSASRDFTGDGVAVEVKSTGEDTRRHTVHPIEQVLADPQRPGERVYVYSVGLRPDRSSSFRLLTAYRRAASCLTGDALQTFNDQLRHYGGSGFDPRLSAAYDLEIGFTLTHHGALFRTDNVPDLLRPESFVGGAPPSRAKRIRYQLVVEGLPVCRAAERDVVFLNLIGRS